MKQHHEAYINKMVYQNKRGTETLHYLVIYLLLTVIFFSGMFIFVYNASSAISFKERSYCRQIALIIDSMEDGTTVTLNLEYLKIIAKENDYRGSVLSFVKDESGVNKVRVQLSSGSGQEYRYFTNIKEPNFNDGGNSIVIEMPGNSVEVQA